MGQILSANYDFDILSRPLPLSILGELIAVTIWEVNMALTVVNLLVSILAAH